MSLILFYVSFFCVFFVVFVCSLLFCVVRPWRKKPKKAMVSLDN